MSDLAALLARFPRLGLAQLPTPLEPLQAADGASGRADDLDQARRRHRVGLRRQQAAQARFCAGRGRGGESRHVGVGRGGAIQQPAPGRGRRRQAGAGMSSRRLSWPGRAAVARNMSDPAMPSSIACSARICMTCPGPATATPRSRFWRRVSQAKGKQVFVVPYGVSNAAGRGGLCFRDRGNRGSVARRRFHPAAIVHSCSGSGGTQAGLYGRRHLSR